MISLPKFTTHDWIMIAVGVAAATAFTVFIHPAGAAAVSNLITRAVFETGGGRPRGKIGVMGGDGQFHDVEFLFDTGNDITLITRETAQQIGLQYQNGTPFTVSGVGGEVKNFMMIQAPIKIGNDDPITVRIGVGDVPENLLGYQDVAPEYTISYSKNKQVLFQEDPMSRVAVSSNHDSLETRAVDRRFWWY